MILALPKAEYLRLDFFPALVKGDLVPGGLIDRVRAVVTDAHIHVLSLDMAANPELIVSVELDSIEGTPTDGYTVTTTDGDELFIRRSAGCGCGATRLKGVQLFDYVVPFQSRM